MLCNDLCRRIFNWNQPALPFPLLIRYDGPFPFDPIENDCRKKPVPTVVEHLRSVCTEQKCLAAVRKEVSILACQCVAKRGSLPSIHFIGGYHAEVQGGRHFQKHFEFIDLRTVFRSCKVEIEEALDGLFAGLFPDAQVGGLAPQGTNTARLQTHFV